MSPTDHNQYVYYSALVFDSQTNTCWMIKNTNKYKTERKHNLNLMDSSVARLATEASFKSFVHLPQVVFSALSFKLLPPSPPHSPSVLHVIQFLYSFPLLFSKISAILLFCRFPLSLYVCVRALCRDVLYLWNLFCFGRRKDVGGGGIGLAETNHTRKWHIDSMNYLFFPPHSNFDWV